MVLGQPVPQGWWKQQRLIGLIRSKGLHTAVYSMCAVISLDIYSHSLLGGTRSIAAPLPLFRPNGARSTPRKPGGPHEVGRGPISFGRQVSSKASTTAYRGHAACSRQTAG